MKGVVAGGNGRVNPVIQVKVMIMITRLRWPRGLL